MLVVHVLSHCLFSVVFPVCAKMPTNVTAAPENGAPRSELQELQLKAGQVTDEVSKHVSFLIETSFSSVGFSSFVGGLIQSCLLLEILYARYLFLLFSRILKTSMTFCRSNPTS